MALGYDESGTTPLQGASIADMMMSVRQDVLAHHLKEFNMEFSSAVSVSMAEFRRLTSYLDGVVRRADQQSVWSNWFGSGKSGWEGDTA